MRSPPVARLTRIQKDSFIWIWLIAINLAAFAAFGMDKRRARAGAWRISEAKLLLFALIGGTLGAYAGRRFFRHKSRKARFSTALHLIATIQIAAILVFALEYRLPLI